MPPRTCSCWRPEKDSKVATAQPAWIYSAGPLAGAFVGCSAFKAFKGLLDA